MKRIIKKLARKIIWDTNKTGLKNKLKSRRHSKNSKEKRKKAQVLNRNLVSNI